MRLVTTARPPRVRRRSFASIGCPTSRLVQAARATETASSETDSAASLPRVQVKPATISSYRSGRRSIRQELMVGYVTGLLTMSFGMATGWAPIRDVIVLVAGSSAMFVLALTADLRSRRGS